MRDKIQDVVKDGPVTVNQLCRKIHGNRTKTIQTYKEMVDDNSLKSYPEENKIVLAPSITDFDPFFLDLNKKITQIRHDSGAFIRMLRSSRPLCKNQEKLRHPEAGVIWQYTLTKQNRVYLNMIAKDIENLFLQSAAITYAQTLELVPQKFTREIRSYHKKCIETAKEIIEKLVQQHPESEECLRQHILWNTYAYRLFSKLEDISKKSRRSKP